MLASSEGAPMLLMAALAAVTSVDRGVAHFVIVSNEATKLRQLLKGLTLLSSFGENLTYTLTKKKKKRNVDFEFGVGERDVYFGYGRN